MLVVTSRGNASGYPSLCCGKEKRSTDTVLHTAAVVIGCFFSTGPQFNLTKIHSSSYTCFVFVEVALRISWKTELQVG